MRILNEISMLSLFLSKFIFAFVRRIDYDIHSGKYQRATGYQVSVLAKQVSSVETLSVFLLAGCRNPAKKGETYSIPKSV